MTRDRLKTAASVLIFLSLALSGALPVELKLQDYIQDVLVAVDLYGEPTMTELHAFIVRVLTVLPRNA